MVFSIVRDISERKRVEAQPGSPAAVAASQKRTPAASGAPAGRDLPASFSLRPFPGRWPGTGKRASPQAVAS